LNISPFHSGNKIPLSERLEKGVFFMFFLIFSLCLVLSAFYLFQRNKNATLGYKFRILQEERATLLERNEALSMKISDLSTIERLQKQIDMSDMIASTKLNTVFLEGQKAVAKDDQTLDTQKKIF
jgi:hypothetical protein